jgi:hypothetical protein
MTSSVGIPLSSPDMVRDSRIVPEADVDRAMATPLVIASGGESLLSFISISRRCFGAFARRAESLNPQTADRVWLGEKEALRGSAQAFHTLGPEALDIFGDGLLACC